MSLRPYHNPENVDESRVPDGFRFLYADEFGCENPRWLRAWWPEARRFDSHWTDCVMPGITYIATVNA